jgi:peptidyl-prolyl cis-trans isomerase D
MLYSLPVNSFTLINDENNKIYLTQIKNYKNIDIDMKSDKFKSYVSKDNSNNRNHILKSYDIFLSKKYNVIINQASVDRVKNFFQ